MKKTFIAALACLALFGCTNNKNQEKALLDSVIAVHDKVMGIDDQLMHNKMKLDTLLKTKLTGVADTAAEKRQQMGLSVQLTNAEDAMENWMQKFEPEPKGKSHEEIMAYLNDQKTKIIAVDSGMSAAINASTKYLNTIKK
jgi:hypothetical protein